jgi:hypothetical protein
MCLLYLDQMRRVYFTRVLAQLGLISNGHQTTTVITTNHQSHEMAISLGPQELW